MNMDRSAVLRDAIVDGIRSGRWRPGHRIPTEREFSAQYQVGRSTVRRVLMQLKGMRLITQTVGSGTYVAERPEPVAFAAVVDASAAASPSTLMEARVALEPAIVELVIRHATPADFARMDECCAMAEAADALEAFERWDRALHEVIAEAAHNTFVASLFDAMGRARSQSEWGALKRRSLTPERRLEYQAEHRAVVDALKDRDVARATAATRDHLLHVRHNLLGY